MKKGWMLLFGFILLFGLSVFPAEAKKSGKPSYTIGNGNTGLADGDFRRAEFHEPYSAVSDKDKLYLTDSGNHCLRLIDLKTKKVSMFTGTGLGTKDPEELKGYRDAHVSAAKFNEPRGIAMDRSGVIYVADTGNHVIRKIKNNIVYTYAGSGKAGDKSSKLTDSEFNRPSDVAIMGESLYVADSLNAAVKRIEKDGRVVTVLQGNKLIEPSGLYVNKNTLYIADSGAQAIFKYTEDRGFSVVAGGKSGFDSQTGYKKWGYKDGASASALFNFPKALIADKSGLIIADTWNASIRRIKSGKVSTLFKMKEREARPTKILKVKKGYLVIDHAGNRILFYKTRR